MVFPYTSSISSLCVDRHRVCSISGPARRDNTLFLAIATTSSTRSASRYSNISGTANFSSRRTKVVWVLPDGHCALMLVAARLRHVSTIARGTRKYMNMKLLEEMDNEAIHSAA